MADEKRIIGDDGKLLKATVATGASTTFTTGNWYKIATKATSGTKFENLDVGDFFYAPAAVTGATGASNDTAYLLTTTDLIDLAGWSFETTGDEVPVTVLYDKYKKYRRGKIDATGSMRFVFIKGTSDQDGGVANYFFDIAHITAAGAVTVHPQENEALLLVGYLDDTDTSGEAMLALIMEVELFSFTLPMNMSEAVEMEIPYRLTGDGDPILYRITNA